MSTETTTFSVNKNEVQAFERQVQSITVGTGSIVVTGNGAPVTVGEGSTYDAGNSTTLTILAVEASNYAVTFAENAVRPVFQEATAGEQAAPTVRGDADSGDSAQTGSFESRTVPQLRDLAKVRGLTVTGKKGKKPNKADFIKALRA